MGERRWLYFTCKWAETEDSGRYGQDLGRSISSRPQQDKLTHDASPPQVRHQRLEFTQYTDKQLDSRRSILFRFWLQWWFYRTNVGTCISRLPPQRSLRAYGLFTCRDRRTDIRTWVQGGCSFIRCPTTGLNLAKRTPITINRAGRPVDIKTERNEH